MSFPMTPAELEDLQRMVALRMTIGSPNGDLSWKEWSMLLRKRLAGIQMWTVDETRPTFGSCLAMAADAMTLLALVDKAELADMASRDEGAA